MLVAVIDNYDSFTFNLVHYILDTGVDVKVFRNDKISIDDLMILNPDAIVISPGPDDKNSLFRVERREFPNCVPLYCVSQDVAGPKTEQRPEYGRSLFE